MNHRSLFVAAIAAAALLAWPAGADAAGYQSPTRHVVVKPVRNGPVRCMPGVAGTRAGRSPMAARASARRRPAAGPLCGGGSGCLAIEIATSDSHWHGSWNHVFKVSWCWQGAAISWARVDHHTQSAYGSYGPKGVPTPYVSSGCVGCNHMRWNAQANFTYTAWYPPNYTSHFTDWIRVTLYPGGSWSW